MQIRHRKSGSSQPRRGVVTVEVAITLPVLFMTMFGCIEFARMNVLRNTAENACYEGARKASVPGGTADEAIAEAQAELNVVGTRNPTITVTPSVIVDATTEVTVTVDIPLNDNAWVTPLFLKDQHLIRSCTLTRERVIP